MRLFLISFLITFSALATTWRELEFDRTYQVTQSFQLKQLERSGALVDVMAGELVSLKEVVPLAIPNFPMTLYIFDYKNCPGPQMKTDQEIIPVFGTSPLVEVGVELEVNCELNVYVELRDDMSMSFFK